MASSPIDTFIANLKSRGIARVNRFQLTFSPPAAVLAAYSTAANGLALPAELLQSAASAPISDSKTLSIMAMTFSLPGYSVGAADRMTGQFPRKMPFDRSTGEASMVFYSSGDMVEKRLMDVWMHYMFQDNHTLSYYDDYVTDIQLDVLNEGDEVVYSALLTECYPGVVGPIDLDRSAMDTVQTFSVVLNYYRLLENQDGFSNNSQGSTSNVSAPTASNLTFGALVQTPQAIQPALPPAPYNMTFANNQTASLIMAITKINTEVVNGLDPAIAATMIKNLMADANQNLMVGTDFSQAEGYANQALFALKF